MKFILLQATIPRSVRIMMRDSLEPLSRLAQFETEQIIESTTSSTVALLLRKTLLFLSNHDLQTPEEIDNFRKIFLQEELHFSLHC